MNALVRLVLTESYVWVLALIAAPFFHFVTPLRSLAQGIESLLKRLAKRPAFAFTFVFLSGLFFRLALLHVYPVQKPSAHDEYSYLLAADTFHSFRLTNPSPPVSIAFESFHINVLPTYQSMYPPGNGLVLSIGQFLGHPWIAVLLSTALMCAVIYWALAAWLPPGWALLGGWMAVVQYCGFNWWMNRYFMPAAAAIGGALLLGALGRLRKSRNRRALLLFGLGASLLLLTRPYEGFVYALPFTLALLWFLHKHEKHEKQWMRAVLAMWPAACVLVATLLWLGYYNWRGTGSALLMPYQVNWKTYHIIAPLLLQRPQPIPHYHHALMRQFYVDWELARYLQLRSSAGLWAFTQEKLAAYLFFFLPLSIFAFGLGFLKALPSRNRILAIAMLLFAAGLWLESWKPMPHYAAPATALILFFIAAGYRWVRCWRFRRFRIGLSLTRALALILIILSVNNLLSQIVDQYTIYFNQEPQYLTRARLDAQLTRAGGKHLVLVRYSPAHYYEWEWVYNRADLNAAPVVWARSIDDATDAALMRSFPDRQVWLAEPDRMWINLSPYRSRDAVLKGPGPSDAVLATPVLAKPALTTPISTTPASATARKSK